MSLLYGGKRRDCTRDDGGHGDAKHGYGEGNEECHEPCGFVRDGMGHDKAFLHHKAACHVRHLHEGYRSNPRPQPYGHVDGGEQLHQADDNQNEIGDAVEPGPKLTF